MSYVIQNFHDYRQKIAITPRFKFLFFINNLDKFLLFIKINNFQNFNKNLPIFKLNYFALFMKYFYSKFFLNIVNNFNLEYVGLYSNNLTKSFIYHGFRNINVFFKTYKIFIFVKLFQKNYFFNSYFYTIKLSVTKLNKFLFKNIFFFLMLNKFLIWQQYSYSYKIYLNFFFTSYNLKIIRFYNGHFLPIYNF